MIARLWQTVRHLRAEQMVARVRLRASARARRAWPSAASRLYERRAQGAGLRLRSDLLGSRTAEDAAAGMGTEEQRAATASAGAALSGRFTFLNRGADLGWPPDWRAPSQARLWRFHLHYFDELVDLALAAPRERVLELIEHWIASNPLHGRGSTPDAWHPYVVSLRMVNWMIALSATGDAADVPPSIRESLTAHSLFLERNLERDGGGNHLLKNLKAMTLAGNFWTGPVAAGWHRDFGRQFVDELSRQVVADGGHYERSPMYHCQVLGDAIEVAAVLRRQGHDALPHLLTLIRRMDRFLSMVTHPDGGIALFNDAALGMAPEPAALHHAVARLLSGDGAAATTPRLELLLPVSPEGAAIKIEEDERIDAASQAEASGYVVLPRDNAARFLIADVGPVCPDDLPAHAHADLLSFELSVEGRRMIVDSGVGEYAAGSWRDYYRSTRAHNTVSVDGLEQSDCWASFRVGRRARPARVAIEEAAGVVSLTGEHTGFDAVGVRHRRTFSWKPGGFWVITDALIGGGAHSWESFCHLHPDCEIVAEGESWLRVTREASVLDVCWFGSVTASRVRAQSERLQGWYADRFGPPRPSTVLVWGGSGALPATFGYALMPRADRGAPAPQIS